MMTSTPVKEVRLVRDKVTGENMQWFIFLPNSILNCCGHQHCELVLVFEPEMRH